MLLWYFQKQKQTNKQMTMHDCCSFRRQFLPRFSVNKSDVNKTADISVYIHWVLFHASILKNKLFATHSEWASRDVSRRNKDDPASSIRKRHLTVLEKIWTLRKKPVSSAWVTLQPREIADAFWMTGKRCVILNKLNNYKRNKVK